MEKTKNNKVPTEIKDLQSFIGLYDPKKDIASKFDFYIKIVVAIFVVTTVILVVSVGTLIVDSFHFNSATYKEYAAKIETNNTLLKAVKQNQETILEVRKTVQELVEKQNNE